LISTISLHDQLLADGEQLLQLGRTAEARHRLRLFTGSETCSTTRANAHNLLGELEFTVGRFRAARRHFAAVIGLRPYDAEACLRYADAIDADFDADPLKGWAARRRATRIDSFDSRCWTALGLSGVRIGNRKAALKAFRRAARLRPERIETISELVNGFISLGRFSEARAVLTAARFRRPGDARLISLSKRLQFDCLRIKQDRARCESRLDWPTVLPFEGRTERECVEDANPVVIRVDRRSRPMPHLLRLIGRRSDPRQAN
jgi:tetratricopeptide (TPR) repeat protein